MKALLQLLGMEQRLEEHPIPDEILGVPARVKRPNARFNRPYCADRAGIQVTYRGNAFSVQQTDCLWYDSNPLTSNAPLLLRQHQELSPGDVLTVLEDELYDLGVGTLMVRVRHESSRREGFITLETLVGETTVQSSPLWTARAVDQVRTLVEFEWRGHAIYSSNKMSAKEISDSIHYLSRFVEPGPSHGHEILKCHPLETAAHANRLGVWALDSKRDTAERTQATVLIEAMFERYGMPTMREVAEGAWAWDYTFDFQMPWKTRLPAPWHSGYANAAMTSAAACAYALTGTSLYHDIVIRGTGFLQRPMAQGGALYTCDGYVYLAEYVYRSPPIPNYRVLDGELCSLLYVATAAQLTGSSELMAFAIRLGAGLAVSLDMYCAPDGKPIFGMDGQPMNPDYMWQLWVTLQILANLLKDRSFSKHAEIWGRIMPERFAREGYPL